MGYDHAKIESKWQRRWREAGLFAAAENSDGAKFYLFEYPPYPSGGLHVGHVRNYTIGDVTARFKRMQGYEVLYTQGFDSFGLPNEIAAAEKGVHPKEWSEICIEAIKSQFARLGYSYDVDRFVTYHNEDYYKWTQWLFLLLLKNGLAYKKKAGVNWCEKCATVLADDQVSEGRCWRCDGPAQTKYLDQWFFAVQKYADKLLSGLDRLEGWPERIKAVQRNWFGRSEGVEIKFSIEGTGKELAVFTTTPELIYGCTFVAVSVDHPLVLESLDAGAIAPDVAAKIETIRDSHNRKPTIGAPLGLMAVNPVTGKTCPVFAADYIQSAYGTGAIFGVPAHDSADREFARRHGLAFAPVVQPAETRAGAPEDCLIPEENDLLINSGSFSGQTVKAGRISLAGHLTSRGFGRRAVHFRVRDWLISRQRYWGAPIPVVYCPECGVVPVPENQLPVKLPDKVDFKTPGNPLARHEKFIECRCYECGGPARRETDTMDTFVNSSWFYYRYCSPRHAAFIFDRAQVERWMPADLAIGGVEHATTVYIHDRFITKVLYDNGLVPSDEPFSNLIAHELVIKDGKKMSKSLGNTVDPNDLIAKYGADALRLAILGAAPPEKRLEFKEAAVESCRRWTKSLWRLIDDNRDDIKAGLADDAQSEDQPPTALDEAVGAAVREITADLEKYRFNGAVHGLFKLLKVITDTGRSGFADAGDRAARARAIKTLLLLSAPFAPHLSEELWAELGLAGPVCRQLWPEAAAAIIESKDMIIQINGKVVKILKEAIPAGAGRQEITDLALDQATVANLLSDGLTVKRVLIDQPTHVIVNIVAKENSLSPAVERRAGP